MLVFAVAAAVAPTEADSMTGAAPTEALHARLQNLPGETYKTIISPGK